VRSENVTGLPKIGISTKETGKNIWQGCYYGLIGKHDFDQPRERKSLLPSEWLFGPITVMATAEEKEDFKCPKYSYMKFL
jgi:hypothetical protein